MLDIINTIDNLVVEDELQWGEEVFYTLEDYATGKEVIHRGYVIGYIDNREVNNTPIGRIYAIGKNSCDDESMEVMLQRKSLYTIEDLFAIAKKVEKNESNH